MNPSSLNTTTLEAQDDEDILEDPLFWSMCVQLVFSLFIFAITMYLRIQTTVNVQDCIKSINCEIQLVEQRLRMQDPSVHLMEKVAKQLNIPYDGLGGYSTKLFNIMWDTEEVSVSNDVNKKRSKK